MNLISVRIRNYQSLEDVSFDDLTRYNAVVGVNNSGKSAFHRALYLLSCRMKGDTQGSPERFLTDGDLSRTLEIELTAVLSEQQRAEWVQLIAADNDAASLEERLLSSPFAREVRFHFASGTNSNVIHLTKTLARGEDGEWLTFHSMTGSSETSNPTHELASFKLAAVARPLTHTHHINDAHTRKTSPTLALVQWAYEQPTPQVFLQRELAAWLGRSFFFQPDRKSSEELPAVAIEHLDLRGSNLAQVLHTIHNNDRPRFRWIEGFVAAGLPGLGELHTPLRGNATHVAFQFSRSTSPIRLHEMGGGIEQVLMLAVVLSDQKLAGPVFMDEPESHLHPRAQRFVAEQLKQCGRQVFVGTHASVFADRGDQCSLFRMGIRECRSIVSRIRINSDLAEALSDMGYRLADLTFAERVLFVEGPADEAILRAWDRNSVISHSNVAMIHMNGAPLSHLRVRAHSLREASLGLRVPFHFLIDRDEMSQEDLSRLHAELGDCITRLPCREIENLLIDAPALASCIAMRVSVGAGESTDSGQRQEAPSPDLVAKRLEQILVQQKSLALAKKLKAWLKRRVLESAWSEMRRAEEACHHWKDLDDWCGFLRAINSMSGEAALREAQAAYHHFEREIDDSWKDPEARRLVAPGTEVLETLYGEFRLKYNKRSDGPAVAQHMAQVPSVIDILFADLAKRNEAN